MSSSVSSGSEEEIHECVGCDNGQDISLNPEAHMGSGGCLYGNDLDDDDLENLSLSEDDAIEESSSDDDEEFNSCGGVDVSLKKRKSVSSSAQPLRCKKRSGNSNNNRSVLDEDSSMSEKIGYFSIGDEQPHSLSSEEIAFISIG